MNHRAVAAGLMALAASGAPALAQEAGPWSVEGRVGVVSDYRDRGYTLSGEEPALQGEATLSHASGLYVGVWGSTIEEYGIGSDGDGAEVEVTLYAGWAGAVAGFDVDAGVWTNVYPDGDDVNYVEFPLQAGRTFGDATFSAGVVWAPSQTGTGDEANTWVWTRADYAPEAWPVSLHAALGHEDGGFAPDGKTDWRLGVAAPLGGFTLGVDWVDSDTEDSAVVASVFRGF
ncbi:TorF family putative porin [Brevundimonas sp.]|uniref:TorF family putative porin n=1 Tax=Brevundimonas sp. TaxID=1871086 RepID=UPI002737FC87|nr:TorF family putative porin [Brevundimonas sp.]MDP3802443.1 TorF family putative porin [Brevundimonas sp.]